MSRLLNMATDTIRTMTADTLMTMIGNQSNVAPGYCGVW